MPTVVGSILDNVGWRATADLTDARLLEPAAGDGAFLVQAAKRLVASFRSRDIEPTIARLRMRITAFELHPGAASQARNRVRTALRQMRVHHGTAAACAKAWIRNADFLLCEQPPPDHTHAVGNPPYVRWSRIPARLKSIYDSRLPRHVTRGDLFLPFLDRVFRSLQPAGKCGFLCSDRWMYMAFGERFRQEWMPWLDILSNDSVNASDVFHQRVDIYPTILVASKRSTPKTKRRPTLPNASRTLDDLGCVVKVGPALGHAPAFVLRPNEDDVESELLRPWIAASEVLDGSIEWSGRRVVILFDDDGRLHDLRRFPRLQRRLPSLHARTAQPLDRPQRRTMVPDHRQNTTRRLDASEVARSRTGEGPPDRSRPFGRSTLARRIRNFLARRPHRRSLPGTPQWRPRPRSPWHSPTTEGKLRALLQAVSPRDPGCRHGSLTRIFLSVTRYVFASFAPKMFRSTSSTPPTKPCTAVAMTRNISVPVACRYRKRGIARGKP